ncbi:hypothetical protein [Salipiger mucosus]|uniref:50S ribosomal protein L33 n=1 Tax=Salipiger mucosus DSM 16094 TaxID=1123237 RepID=S9RXC4_9RHOB|nr:hypothetical protein [Salipiger mucosus]EPX78619.1 50S ribosomal protein L33 [Salipiger mucosus DSM 16094]
MKALTLATLLAAAPVAALADSLTLETPLAGGTVHGGTVDMSVFWQPEGEAHKVVAHYAEPGDAAPQRLVMLLNDGDNVVFGLPGKRGTEYRFSREADAVTVTAARTRTQLALN